MDLSKLSDEELKALYAQVQAQPKQQPKVDAQTQRDMDVTADMPWWQQAAAGVGKAVYDTGRGVGNLVTDAMPGAAKLGFATRADSDAAKARDAQLMDTGWGMAGNIAGNVAPALLMPASTIPKALLYGAGMGAAQPVGSGESRTENALMGGAANAALPMAAGVYKAGRALVEPVLNPGKTAARVVEQFADDPQALRLAAAGAKEIIPGSRPTLAEVAQQPGISTLQRGMSNQPGPMQKAITDRAMENNAARVGFLDDLAGTDGKLDFNKAMRQQAAETLYAKAFAEMPEDSAWIKGEVTKLTQRPAFVSALKDGQEMAMNLGIKVSPDVPENTTQILHFTKMALDDKIESAVRAGNGNSSRALIDTRDKLVSLMESKGFSPSYREARDTFKQMSKPINEMEMAGDLRAKLLPAMNDATGTTPTKLYADGMAGEVRRRQGDLSRMSPEFQGKVGDLMGDLQRRASAEGLGRPTGSPTAQYLTTQNLMRQVMGPLGLPNGMADKAASSLMSAPVVGSAMQWATKGAENRVQQEVANLLLNPSQYGQSAASLYRAPGAVQQKLLQMSPYAGGLATRGLFAYGSQ
jgi:hypothetical protein